MNTSTLLRRAARLVASVLKESATRQRRSGASATGRRESGPPRPTSRPSPRSAPGTSPSSAGHGAGYPGDHEGPVRPVYAPDLDGEPDPGEIVWTWVPFEEDHSRGKDRPVLVVGHDGPWLLALMLSTRDRDADPGPRRERWVDLGTGDWDAQRRPSEVRVDRVVRVDPDAVRREGAVLDRVRFELVASELAASSGW